MKRILVVLLSVVLCFSSVACQKKDTEKKGSESNTVAESVKVFEIPELDIETTVSEDGSESVVYPITVTDQLNREVTIEKEPESIVSAYYISTSLLLALGEKDNLVGIEAKADSRNLYHLCAKDIISLPSVGTAKEFDLEGCVALNPDLVVIPAKLESVIPSLEELGITVIAVNPESADLLNYAVVMLGAVTNNVDTSEGMLQYTSDKLTNFIGLFDKILKPSVYITSNSSLLSTAGQNMYQNSLIEYAGGVNVASELTDTYWSEISYEQLIEWNPEYIIIAADADFTVEDVLNDPALSSVSAVVDQKVYQFPSDIEAWDSPVPAGVLGNIWLASVLHPEMYPEDTYKEDVVEFYETYYGFTPVLD